METIQVYLSDILHIVAQWLLVPDIILLLAFIGYALFCIGSLITEFFMDRRHFKVVMPKFLTALTKASKADIPLVIKKSGLLKRQKDALMTVYDHQDLPGDALMALIKREVEQEEARYDRITGRNNMAARVSPMLGLMGTLIPLGPGIEALGRADTAALSSSLLVAFDTTVAGLVVAAVCLVVGKIRSSWYNNYLSALDASMATLLEKIEDMKAGPEEVLVRVDGHEFVMGRADAKPKAVAQPSEGETGEAETGEAEAGEETGATDACGIEAGGGEVGETEAGGVGVLSAVGTAAPFDLGGNPSDGQDAPDGELAESERGTDDAIVESAQDSEGAPIEDAEAAESALAGSAQEPEGEQLEEPEASGERDQVEGEAQEAASESAFEEPQQTDSPTEAGDSQADEPMADDAGAPEPEPVDSAAETQAFEPVAEAAKTQAIDSAIAAAVTDMFEPVATADETQPLKPLFEVEKTLVMEPVGQADAEVASAAPADVEPSADAAEVATDVAEAVADGAAGAVSDDAVDADVVADAADDAAASATSAEADDAPADDAVGVSDKLQPVIEPKTPISLSFEPTKDPLTEEDSQR